jgi:hypothetical protein
MNSAVLLYASWVADPRDAIRQHAETRQRALIEADQALIAMVPLLQAALDAGTTKVELAEMVGVSRPTLDGLLRDGVPRPPGRPRSS